MDEARGNRSGMRGGAMDGTRNAAERQDALLNAAPTVPGDTDKQMIRTDMGGGTSMSVSARDPGNLSTSVINNLER